MEASTTTAELAMIDENLCRAELSPSDRARQTARRKAIYEELHPETRHGGNGVSPSGQFVHTGVAAFASETAAAVGRDERSVRRDAERGEKVTEEAIGLIRGTHLDTGAYLDKLKRMTPEDCTRCRFAFYPVSAPSIFTASENHLPSLALYGTRKRRPASVSRACTRAYWPRKSPAVL